MEFILWGASFGLYNRVGQFFRMQKYSVWYLKIVKKSLNWPFFIFKNWFALRKFSNTFPPPYILVVQKNKLHFLKCLNTVLNSFEGGESENNHNFSKFHSFLSFFAFLHLKKNEKLEHLLAHQKCIFCNTCENKI